MNLIIREDLSQAIDQTWQHITSPGTWLSSSQRLAVATEARIATSCTLCEQRLAALSPLTALNGDHDHDHHCQLNSDWIDLVHRIRTDHARFSSNWLHKEIIGNVVSDTEYVEIISIVALVTALDTFTDTLGLPRRELLSPLPGKPSRYRPDCAQSNLAWIATIDPDDASGPEVDIYANQSAANIHRALSLVPQEKLAFFALDDVMYLPDQALRQFDKEFRAIDHQQIELLAARVSAINQCYY